MLLASGGEFYVAQNFAHVLPVYSESQFRDEVVAAFIRLRKAQRMGVLEVQSDTGLRAAACSGEPNPEIIIRRLPGVTDLVAFTASSPEKLPASMKKTAGDPKLQRMSIGVCFKPGKDHGFASFWVVAAFYGVAE